MLVSHYRLSIPGHSRNRAQCQIRKTFFLGTPIQRQHLPLISGQVSIQSKEPFNRPAENLGNLKKLPC